MSMIQFAERRWLPDQVIRFGMRRMLRTRLNQEIAATGGNFDDALDHFADRARQHPITIETDLANEQHYEVPEAFFELVLGSRLKYSCGWWEGDTTTLDQSEELMLQLTCERAAIQDGMRVLDLGCGWGSLSLWMAEKYPACQITALSNSASQRTYIQRKAAERELPNIEVITADVGSFDTDQQFDRVTSVEMFEHVRNHDKLLAKIANWLVPDGQLFVHIFCHRKIAYLFEMEGEQNWMGRHFFSGGMMPAEHLFERYENRLKINQHWWVNGSHYARTCEQWLSRLDANESAVKNVLAGSGVADPVKVLVQRWRMFFMACAELFQYDDGEQWGVAHYSLVRSPSNN